jgi:hypothetical protein
VKKIHTYYTYRHQIHISIQTRGSLPGKPGQSFSDTPGTAYTCVPLYRASSSSHSAFSPNPLASSSTDTSSVLIKILCSSLQPPPPPVPCTPCSPPPPPRVGTSETPWQDRGTVARCRSFDVPHPTTYLRAARAAPPVLVRGRGRRTRRGHGVGAECTPPQRASV